MCRVIEITENDEGWSKQTLLDARVQKATQKKAWFYLCFLSPVPQALSTFSAKINQPHCESQAKWNGKLTWANKLKTSRNRKWARYKTKRIGYLGEICWEPNLFLALQISLSTLCGGLNDSVPWTLVWIFCSQLEELFGGDKEEQPWRKYVMRVGTKLQSLPSPMCF